MSLFKEHADQLLKCLDNELSLLKAGRLTDAVALTQDKGKLLRAFEDGLQGEGVSHSARKTAEIVVAKARECERHLLAIRNGMKSVVTRLENLDHDSYVGSYNQYGTKTSFTGATGSYLKKI